MCCVLGLDSGKQLSFYIKQSVSRITVRESRHLIMFISKNLLEVFFTGF